MNRFFISYLIIFSAFVAVPTVAQELVLKKQNDRWSIQPDGSLQWKIDSRIPHYDHIEMSGEKVSLWLQYGVDSSGKSVLNRTMVFPSYRLLPQRTTSSMMYNVTDNDLPHILVNDRILKAAVYNASVQNDLQEKVVFVTHRGITEIYSSVGKDSIELKRILFPSVEKPLAVEQWVFYNRSKRTAKIEMEYLNRETRPSSARSKDPLRFIVSTINDGEKTLQPNDSCVFTLIYQAVKGSESVLSVDGDTEKNTRLQRVHAIQSLLVLETPDELLNTAFRFAKLRATESIFRTKGGLMHGPGGLRYYAAIWANDQAEYVNPFFAYLGDEIANQSAMNAYRLFARYINKDYKPIPSSIIAEGDGTWHGRKDRGDMAMIAYGAGRYALTFGNADSATVLWPLIEWCLEYLKRNINEDGVVFSDSDELEGRFPSGKANLHTSALYYDALRSAQMLGKELKLSAALLNDYALQEKNIRTNIEKYFGASVEGFNTYRYYKGNDTLRAWITTPLTVDIFDRKKGTVDALFSPRLWTEDGLASLAGNQTFWDRSTLYALRGVLAAGEKEKALRFLNYYSRRRLLGEHVPYPVEAYPEGNQRHLSAESGLYCRIYTEGMFGMRPTGFKSFDCTPQLPAEWNNMALRNVHSFGTVFDVEVKRVAAGKLNVIVTQNGKQKTYSANEGSTLKITL